VSDETLFQFGYVSRAHGLNGEVVVRTFDPASSALADVGCVIAKLKDGSQRSLTVLEVREGPGGDLLASFEGLTSRVAADVLRGSGLFVRRADLDEPDDGEFFQGDLIGLTAVTAEGLTVGTLAEIWSTGPVPNLVIRQGEVETLIPFAEEFVTKVDLEARQVVVVLPVYEE
jgi:16S rRNA processing protein RimM